MSFSNLKISRKLMAGFAVLVLISMVSSGLSILKMQSVGEATTWNNHTFEVLAAADAVGKAMVDQETGVRGYLIAGDNSFLAPFEAGRQDYAKAYERLKSLTADNPAQQERIAALGASADGWRTHVAEAEISAMKAPATVAQARQTESSGAGKGYMDQIRAKLQEIKSVENGLLATRAERQRSDQGQAVITLIVGGLVGVISSFAIGLTLTRGISTPINSLNVAMRRLAGGDHDIELPAIGRKDEVGDMAAAVQVFRDAAIEKKRLEAEAAEQGRRSEAERARHEAEQAEIARQQALVVDAIGEGLTRLSSGDLVFRISEPFAPEYEKLRGDFNGAIQQLQETMKVISTAIHGIRSGTEQISQAADDLSKRTEQQAASLEETAAALDEITATVRKTADGANHARDAVSNAKTDAEHSGQVVREAVLAMSEIEKSAEQISQIIGVIDEIAFQTNLLALNAGVEAARAGDAGKGFAVVASEVRALAQRSAEAAKEIKTLISASSQQVGAGVSLVGQTGEALTRIVGQVGDINSVVSEIAASAQEQATGLNQVNTAVNQMDQVTQQNAAMVEESTAGSHSLAQEADELARLIARFKVAEQDAAKPTRRAAQAPRTALKTVSTHARGGGAALKPEPADDIHSWEEF